MTGKIIKSSGSPEPDTGGTMPNVSVLAGESPVVKGEIVQALGTAARIVDDARKKAREILEQAAARESEIETAARQRGYEEGLSEWNRTILHFKEEYRKILAGSEQELVKLSVRLAGKIVGRALELEPAVLLDILRQAVQSLKYQREIRLRVHPDDAAYLREHKMDLMARLGESKSFIIEEDPLIGSGGCIVETEIGTIDARLETQLRILENRLLSRQS